MIDPSEYDTEADLYKAERDEARRVARVLAAGFYSDAGSDEELLAAIATALTYPKPEPEPQRGERDA